MLVEQLSVAFKCHSAIGNSTNLKEMIHEVLKTFVNETYAIYAEFCLCEEGNNCYKFDSFGKVIDFNFKKYRKHDREINTIEDEEADTKIVSLSLENGTIFLVTKNLAADCTFFISMFQSLLPKLNLSVNACLNVEKLIVSNKLLEKEKQKLINANKTKDDFLANMSHELKTPLNSIIILSSIMKKNKNNTILPKELRNVTVINNSANDLLDLINDVLDISKIESGQFKIVNNNLNIKELVLNEFEILKPLVKKEEVNFSYDFKGEDFEIVSDRLRLKQILKNLLSNAIKFTQKGNIDISTVEFEDYIEISVKDTGIGIEGKKLEDIFDRFKQIDTSISKKYSGTGLGLAISKELTYLLNSKLDAFSKVGCGSTFILRVPKKETIQLETVVEKEHYEEEVLVKEEIKSKNVLLIHSKSIKLFSFTIALNKHFSVTPFDSTEKLLTYISLNKNKDEVLVYDDEITQIKEVLKLIKNRNYQTICLDNKADPQSIIDKIVNIKA